MEDDCDCEMFFNNFNELISLFMKEYGKFLKTRGINITNSKLFRKLQDNYDVLISITKSIMPKGDECLARMKSCTREHSKQIDEIATKVSKSKELIEKINRHFESIKKEIPKDNFEYQEEDEGDKNKIEDMTDKEIMENDRNTIILIENLLDDPDFKAKNKQHIKDIIKIKNEIKDIQSLIEVKLNNDDEIIDHIESNIDNGFVMIEKGNKQNLEKAARDAIKRRRLEYQAGLTIAFGALGSIIPGIGNIIGAGVGAVIGNAVGYGIYRFDNHRLKKVIEKYQKENNKNIETGVNNGGKKGKKK